MLLHYLFIFYSFYISFSCVSLLTVSSSLLSSSIDPSLICTSPAATNPSLPTFPLSLLNPNFVFSLSLSLSPLSFSLSVFSSDQVPYYPTYLKSEHSVSLCTHPQATPLVAKSGGQYQLGLNSSMKIVKPCPSVQVSSISTKSDRVLGMDFSLAVLIFLGFCFVLLHWF